MGIKTNELQKSTSVLGTDCIIADTDATGTARVPFNVAAEYYKDIFMTGGVPYGKALTESWATLQARIRAGNFAGIHIGDYKTITLSTGETVVMEVAGIDQYYKCGDSQIGHHVDFISRDCLSGTKTWNATNDNNGTEAEPSPWRASRLFNELNNTDDGIITKLPSDLQSCIIEKRALIETRYSSSGKLTEPSGWAWNNMGKLWLPTEIEVWGTSHWTVPGYATAGGGCNKQYPIFIGNSIHLIKGNGNGGGRYDWWASSVHGGSSARVCGVYDYGDAYYHDASSSWVCAPLCFRIG